MVRDPDIRPDKSLCPRKILRRDTDHLKRMFVHFNSLAHDVRIALEPHLPARVAQHRHRTPIHLHILSRSNEPSQPRLNPQRVEVVAPDLIPPHRLGNAPRPARTATHANPHQSSYRYRRKAAVAVPYITIVRVGEHQPAA